MISILTRVVFSNTLRNSKNFFLSSRFYPKGNHKRPKSKLNSFVLTKYVNFAKMIETNLKKYFPRSVKFYEVFSIGLKYLKADCIILYQAFKKVTSHGTSSLTKKELRVYYQLPKDMMRAGPVLIIGATIPLGALIFLTAYYFPRQLLTYHFWSIKQRNEFALLSHKRKLGFYKPIYMSMEEELGKFKDKPLYNEMSEILKSLGSGGQPNIDLIISCKELFKEAPFGLDYLSRQHIVWLLRIFDMHRLWRRQTRLKSGASLLKLMDTAIVNEGGLEQLSQDDLIWHCFLRGLNPIDMKEEDIADWMTTWLRVSQHVDENSYSLLLHCPILLGYTQPSNWWLLHDKRK